MEIIKIWHFLNIFYFQKRNKNIIIWIDCVNRKKSFSKKTMCIHFSVCVHKEVRNRQLFYPKLYSNYFFLWDRVSLYRSVCPGTHPLYQCGHKLRNFPAFSSKLHVLKGMCHHCLTQLKSWDRISLNLQLTKTTRLPSQPSVSTYSALACRMYF